VVGASSGYARPGPTAMVADVGRTGWASPSGSPSRRSSSAKGNGFTPMGSYDATFGLLLLIAYLPVTRVTKLRS
jgi:hypothetical protein